MRTPRRVLLVGGGGREHALAWRIAGEDGVDALLAIPGSAAIAALPGVTVDPTVRATDPAAVVAAARSFQPDLVVIGPEAPLAAGVADALRAAGYPVFGPDAAAARIESSKAFCHQVAGAAGIRMAQGGAATTRDQALHLAAALVRDGCGVVVKADGLAAGKGVTVCDDGDDAFAAIDAIFADGDDPDGRPKAVIEERLTGPEASIIALCDGTDAVALPAARDHKRLADGDAGPNTGGMGAYSPLPDVGDALIADALARFHRPALHALAERGTPFRGALYAGLMLTPDRGPLLLEFNARFGDPETQVILPRLAVPLAPLLLAAAEGRLREAADEMGIGEIVPSVPEAAVGVVLATRDYPERPRAGDPIDGLTETGAAGEPAADGTTTHVFHAGTRRAGTTGWETDGGRVLAVVALAASRARARLAANSAACRITFDGVQRRSDIAATVPAPAEALP